VADSCDRGREPSVSMERGEFLDWPGGYWLLRGTVLHGVIGM
jgi:hypothetical protein